MTFEIRWKVTEHLAGSLMLTVEYHPAGKWRWKSLVYDLAAGQAYVWYAPNSMRIAAMTNDQITMMLKHIIDTHYGGSMEEYVKAVAAKELEKLIENASIQDEAAAFRKQITTWGWRRTTVIVETERSK